MLQAEFTVTILQLINSGRLSDFHFTSILSIKQTFSYTFWYRNINEVIAENTASTTRSCLSWRQICRLGNKNPPASKSAYTTHKNLLKHAASLEHCIYRNIHSLTSTVNSFAGAGVGILISLSHCIWGATADLSSLLPTGCPIGPNITVQAQSSPATQLTHPDIMLEGGHRVHKVYRASILFISYYCRQPWLINSETSAEDHTVTEQTSTWRTSPTF